MPTQRVVLTVEEVGHAGEGLVAHLAPGHARRSAGRPRRRAARDRRSSRSRNAGRRLRIGVLRAIVDHLSRVYREFDVRCRQEEHVGVTPIIPAPRDLDAEQQRDIERFERAVAQYLGRRDRRRRLPGDAPEQRRLRPAPGRHQPDGAHQAAGRHDHAGAARPDGPPRRDLLARLGPHHHPAERADALRRAHPGPRGHARPRRRRPHHP